MRELPRRSSRNIQYAGRQQRHTGRSCAQTIGSTRRWRVGDEHRRRVCRCPGRQRHVRQKRSYDPNPGIPTGFARRALAPPRPASLRIVWACVQYAVSVLYQRGDAERSERGGRCLRTTSTRCIQRVPRHVTNRLPPRCSAARRATRASRRSANTRSRHPRCVRFRLLAPQSLRGPVPSVVRRITERNRRPRQDACHIGIAVACRLWPRRPGIGHCVDRRVNACRPVRVPFEHDSCDPGPRSDSYQTGGCTRATANVRVRWSCRCRLPNRDIAGGASVVRSRESTQAR